MPSLAAQVLLLQALHASLQSVCPIVGVSVGNWASPQTTTTIWFDPTSTPAQQASCTSFIATFVPPATISAPVSFPSFINNFTAAEQTAIFGSNDAKIRQWIAIASSKGILNPTEAAIKSGLDYLVSQSIITAARETAILAAMAIN